MASRKYFGDYRLENVEKNGKLKTVAVYRGKYYRFARPDELRGARPRLLLYAALFWLGQIAALTLRTDCAHRAYVIMPMVFAMLPFWFASMGIYAALTGGEKLRREQAEKLETRFSGGSLIAAVLSGASFTGSLVSFIVSGAAPGAADIIFSLCAAAQTASAALCFGQRGLMRTEQLPDE